MARSNTNIEMKSDLEDCVILQFAYVSVGDENAGQVIAVQAIWVEYISCAIMRAEATVQTQTTFYKHGNRGQILGLFSEKIPHF